jgi:ATP-dependent DNA helicase HFM1/MER3
MRQIPKCGKKSVQALAQAGLRSLDQVLAQDPRALERVVNKAFPHGNHLHDAIRSLPCAMALHIERANDARGGVVNVEVTFSASAPPPSDEAEAGVTESSRRWTAHLIVGTTWNDELLHNERIVQRGPGPDNVEAGVPVTRSVALTSAPPAGQEVTIVATLMFDKCVGRDADAVLRVRAAGFVGGGGTPIGRRVGAIGGNAANVVSPSGRHRVAAGKENNLSPAFCRLMAAPPAAPKPVPRAIWTEPLISETATLGVGPGRSHAPPPVDAFEDVTEWNPSGTLRPAPVDADDGWGGSGDDDDAIGPGGDLPWGGADAHSGPPPMHEPPPPVIVIDDDDAGHERGRLRREPRRDPAKRARSAVVAAEPSTPVPDDAGFTDPTSGLTLDLLCDDW